jgi:N-acyl homoserine lactone hydrolase
VTAPRRFPPPFTLNLIASVVARDIARVAISHTHGDHIGNVGLFPNSAIMMQRAEYNWINSPNGPNDNVNQLMALAREL